MAFCSSCGHELGEGAAFCPACGQKVSAPAAAPVFEEEDIRENKLIAVLAYLNVLVLVPILAGRKSPFARYHAKQGLALFITEMLLHFTYGTLKSVLSPFVSHITVKVGYGSYNWLEIVLTMLGVVAFAYLVFAVIGIIRVVRGEAKPLPLIGSLPFLK